MKNFTRIEELFANDIEVTFPSLIYQIDFYAYTCSKYATFWRLIELTAQVIGKKEVQQVYIIARSSYFGMQILPFMYTCRQQ